MLGAIVLIAGLVAVFAIASDTGQDQKLTDDELKGVYHTRLRWYF